VGFPGETEEDFAHTMDVVEQVRYDSAFTFIYSKRSGTPAAVMEEQVPEEVVKERFHRLLTKVQEISAQKTAVYEGKVEDVLVEEVNKQDAALLTGRTSQNYLVHFPGDASLIGKILPVKLRESKGFYFLGDRER
jgi:tRNA-2-methylthio-N6-dimethylallyladenosine synthase